MTTKRTTTKHYVRRIGDVLDLLDNYIAETFEHALDAAGPEDRADLLASLGELVAAAQGARQRLEAGPSEQDCAGLGETAVGA